jgi:hypothetical protein
MRRASEWIEARINRSYALDRVGDGRGELFVEDGMGSLVLRGAIGGCCMGKIEVRWDSGSWLHVGGFLEGRRG